MGQGGQTVGHEAAAIEQVPADIQQRALLTSDLSVRAPARRAPWDSPQACPVGLTRRSFTRKRRRIERPLRLCRSTREVAQQLFEVRAILGDFGKEVIFASLSAEAQPPMLVPDQTELSPAVCAAVLQPGHQYHLRAGSCSGHTNRGTSGRRRIPCAGARHRPALLAICSGS
jgi:hypothetical protein